MSDFWHYFLTGIVAGATYTGLTEALRVMRARHRAQRAQWVCACCGTTTERATADLCADCERMG